MIIEPVEPDRFLLILTGTITPAKNSNVSRRDPSIRRKDYLEAFRYWINHPDPRLNFIIFAENSGADLTDFRREADTSGKEVEIMSLDTSPLPEGMHYGYAEMKLLDQALAESLLRKRSSHMIKVTGRLVFPDLPSLMNHLRGDIRLVVDARARLPFRPSEKGFVSVQLFIAKHEFYDERLRKSYQLLAPSGGYPSFIEHLFWELLIPERPEEGVLLRFPINCEPVGFAGSSGANYRGLSKLMVSKARALSRIVAPEFWL